ncbi:MAG: GntR family transcriptional regulator [Clostridia bacterium]|nr:GntR family transcriptional regulator [Clostridia bacterium]
MKMLISNSSSVPIYEQIKKSIINQILDGELKEDEALPSIRVLAQDIKISAMTIKKAYDELEAEGYLKSIQGKGTFVAPKNTELAKEQAQKDIEKYIEKIVAISNRFEICEKDVIEMFKMFYEEGL